MGESRRFRLAPGTGGERSGLKAAEVLLMDEREPVSNAIEMEPVDGKRIGLPEAGPIIEALCELPTTPYEALELARHVFSDRLEVTEAAIDSAAHTSFTDAVAAWRALRTLARTMYGLHFDPESEFLCCSPLDADEVTLVWHVRSGLASGATLRARYEPVPERRVLALLWFGD